MRKTLFASALALLLAACGAPSTPAPEALEAEDAGVVDSTNTDPVAPPTEDDAGAPAPDSGGPPDPACATIDPFPSTLQNPEVLDDRRGELRFVARDGKVLTAFTHRSESFDGANGPILFVIHGAGRNAEGYLNAWRDAVDAAGALAIAPRFPKDLYPTSESFNLGVGTDGTPRSSTYEAADWRAPSDYTLSEIEHLFEAVRDATGNTRCRYLVYGHSAGGQFVHRLVTFRPDARIERAVAANAGWYTLPTSGESADPNLRMPYGLTGAPPDPTRLPRMFAQKLVVLLGEDDVERDSDLRKTAQADAQGANRFERGTFYFATAKQEAEALDVPLAWVRDTVPGVAHSNKGMSARAAEHLFAK